MQKPQLFIGSFFKKITKANKNGSLLLCMDVEQLPK